MECVSELQTDWEGDWSQR